jgi:formylmethanofuran dehydrogenase subunit D
MRFLLNTGRTITQGKFVEHKTGVGYSQETSTCFINPLDLMDLGAFEGEHVRVTSEWGSVVFRAEVSEEVEPGVVFVPYGPFANHIIPGRTHSTGMPDFKSIPVEIEPTDDKPAHAWDLLEDIGGMRYEGE